MKLKKQAALNYYNFLSIFFPVGSYYKTVDTNIDPNKLFPHTEWKKLDLEDALIISGGLGKVNNGGGLIIQQNNIKKTNYTTDSTNSSHNHYYWPAIGYSRWAGYYNNDRGRYTGYSSPSTYGTDQGIHTHSFTIGVDNPIPIELHKCLNYLACYIWERVK